VDDTADQIASAGFERVEVSSWFLLLPSRIAGLQGSRRILFSSGKVRAG
jgi:hypothetical protein